MPTILIADEAGLFVALETTPILRAGCEIVPVHSAGELLARAATRAPDLFLLDADLLGRQARECIRSLKADRKLSAVPIVIAARDLSALELLLSERDVAFRKPVSPDSVGAALKSLLPLARRSGPRVPVSVSVTCRIDGKTLRLRTKDVGEGGLFLKTDDDLPRGTRFEASFALREPGRVARESHAISALCEVVRRVEPEAVDLIAGVGAAFVRIAEPDAGFLRRFVSAEGV
jgi:CheY-like chemotaxis protein